MTEIVSVSQTDLKWPKYTGKVRDTYDLGDGLSAESKFIIYRETRLH